MPPNPVKQGPIGPKLRGILRLSSALTMLCFVICHLINHALALVSITLANTAHAYLLGPWRSQAGSALLLLAGLTHYGNALWSIYVRRSLRMSSWQLWQLGLGLSIPLLWMLHFASTRLAESLLRVTPDYTYVLVRHWVVSPWHPILQTTMLLTVWTHASIGIHFWLRSKPWYPRWRGGLLAFAVVLPTLALAGYVSAGNQVIRQARNGSFVQDVLDDANLTAQATNAIDRMAAIGWSLHLLLVTTSFAGRGIRRWAQRTRGRPLLAHSSGRSIPISPGATILETLQDNGIAHASVCGGRGRCTTCRVRVVAGLDALPAAGPLESRALEHFHAAANVRLACQVRPTADVSVVALLPPGDHAAMRELRGGVAGTEKFITVVFIDLRGSTKLGEAKLPYDVLFILNQFFHEMTNALSATNGHYANFTGDGLMALYGLDSDDAAASAADAVRGAGEMLSRLARLNRHLATELPQPLRMGIGIHSGNAIVGTMGPPSAQHRGALGDTVNTAARLESLCKDYDCPLILSRQTAELAGFALDAKMLRTTTVKGKDQPVAFYALAEVPV
jgi:adenylate cyclase